MYFLTIQLDNPIKHSSQCSAIPSCEPRHAKTCMSLRIVCKQWHTRVENVSLCIMYALWIKIHFLQCRYCREYVNRLFLYGVAPMFGNSIMWNPTWYWFVCNLICLSTTICWTINHVQLDCPRKSRNFSRFFAVTKGKVCVTGIWKGDHKSLSIQF